MTLHRPDMHSDIAVSHGPGRRAPRATTHHLKVADTRSARPRPGAPFVAGEAALASFRAGAPGRIGRVMFVAGAATLSWAGVIMIGRALLG